MSTTENLKLPYLMASQAQKHVTHNEALQILDALVHLAVLSRSVSVPPASVQAGARYLVPDAASDGWSGQGGNIAVFQDGVWVFHTPQAGWFAYVMDEMSLLIFSDGSWGPVTVKASLPERLGLNTSAEAPNRLALAGDASLFTHEGAGHRLNINKASAAETASVLFQTGYSGRAEMGLAGDDDFHFKVSADGSEFVEAMVVDRSSGRVRFPAGVTGVREQLTADRHYYVSTSGSNANDGLSPAAPFATLQKAVDEAHKLDCSLYNVFIALSDGIYAGATIKRALMGGGTLFVTGNDTTPANVVLNSSMVVSGNARLSLSGVKISIAANWQNGLSVSGGAQLFLGHIDFGQMGSNCDHVHGVGSGEIYVQQDYTISGGARRHISLTGPLLAEAVNRTITLVGTPAFDIDFFHVASSAVVTCWNLTVSGSATGRRFFVQSTGVINLFGKPNDFLPGNAPGLIDSGGVYC